MPLNPWQQAVSNLAHQLGLRGQAEQAVYQSPQYFALIDQFFGPIPLPPGIDQSQVVKNQGGVLEYKDAEGYIHRLQRDVNGVSSTMGQVAEQGTNRPPILPPSKEQQALEGSLTTNSLQNLIQRFQQGIPNAPLPPDLSGLYGQYGQLGQELGRFRNAPAPPDLSGIMGLFQQYQQQFGNTQGQYGGILGQLQAPPQLAALQQGDLANLGTIDANTRAVLAKNQQDLQGQLVAQLYGRNMNQSTVANQAGADFSEAMGRLQLQASSDAAQRQLGLQQFLTQTGQGNLALALQGLGQQGQGYSSLLQSLLGQGNLQLGAGQLALGGYQAEQQARLAQLSQFGQMLGQQGQLALGQGQLNLGGYSAQTGAQSDFYNQMLSALNAMTNLDLSRQVSSGQLGLGQQQLAEQQRQFNVNLSQRQEELRMQERAARDAFTRQLIMGGIGLAGSLFAGPIAGLFGGGRGAGAAAGGGFLTPGGGLPPLGTFGAPPLTGYGGRV